MDELAVALQRVITLEGQESSVDQVLEIASQLEEYVVFFAALDEERRIQLLAPYAERISDTAVLAAELAALASEATGDDSIALALQNTPAFAARGSDTEGNAVPREPIVERRVVQPGDINTLLSPIEVAALAGELELTVRYRDQKSAAASTDPEQVEHIDSFASLTFSVADGSRSLVLMAIDFDSEDAATEHLGLILGPDSGMRDFERVIGDAAAYSEVNQSGIGSMVFFRKGEWIVSLHTTQASDDTPLVDLSALESLARTVVSRLE